MNPKCRFCGGEQENAGFRGSSIPHIRFNFFDCNKCLLRQTYGYTTSDLREFTLRFPTESIDQTVVFSYAQFHYVIDFDPETFHLSVRSYSADEGWKYYFDTTVFNQPDWLIPSLSIEKIKTLILFS